MTGRAGSRREPSLREPRPRPHRALRRSRPWSRRPPPAKGPAVLSLGTEVARRPPLSARRPRLRSAPLLGDAATASCNGAFGFMGGACFRAHGTACAFSPGHLVGASAGPRGPRPALSSLPSARGGRQGAAPWEHVPCMPLQRLPVAPVSISTSETRRRHRDGVTAAKSV